MVTRLNSISSAAGPLIIDNLIMQHKLFDFLSINNKDGKTGFYVKDEKGTIEINGQKYKVVDMDHVLNSHPILKQFSRPLDSRQADCPTTRMFYDMPAGSSAFELILKGDRETELRGKDPIGLPSNIREKIFDDRQLLSKLSDFYQSYLLVASKVVTPDRIHHTKKVEGKEVDVTELEYYIEDFPAEFEGVGKVESLKQKYPDNAFVQAIQLAYEKKSNRAFLNIPATGMKEQEKERLRMAWTDLHKVDPEFSTQLFKYAFYRGGIGFSPKTYMFAVSTYVKEHLKGYNNTYRHFPEVIPELVVDQFVRNNWDNTTLVPRKGGEGTNYQVDLESGILNVRDKRDMQDLEGVKYFKIIVDKETILWKRVGEESENKRDRLYTRIYPLGNNGEYMEMSTTKDMNALTRTTKLQDNNDTTELPETSPMETDAAEADTPTSVPETVSQQSKNIDALVPNVMHLDSTKSPEAAKKHLENYTDMLKEGKLTKGHQRYLVNLLNDAGIQVTMDNVLKEFEKFC